MRTQNIPHQTNAKSVADYTPYEIATIDQFQNANRGFDDEGEEWLENFNEEEN